MTFSFAPAATLLLIAVAAQTAGTQEPTETERLARQIEELNAQIENLQTQLARQQEQLLQAARETRDLRRINDDLLGQVEALGRQIADSARRRPEETVEIPAHGPKDPMTGFVISIAQEYAFVVATIEQKSERDTPQIDYIFNIERGGKLIARGTVSKIIPPSEVTKYTKVSIKITRGRVKDVKLGDTVVAQRSVELKRGAGPAGDPAARITGVIGQDLFAFNRGTNKSLRIGDRAYVYRDDKLIAILRLDMVDPEQSIARLEADSPGRPSMGDVVEFERVGLERVDIIGRVVYSDRDVVLDIGTKHGARPGQRYAVRRHGRPVGFLVLKDVRYDTSIADPVDGTQQEDLQKGDVVEIIQD